MKILKVLLATTVLIGIVGCQKDDRETLNILNFGEYINPDLVSKFEDEFNVKVVYEEVESSEGMYSKITSGAVDYDLAFPSEYVIELMKTEGLLNKLDNDIIVNKKNIDNKYYDLIEFDTEGEYFVPYFTGSVGIMYNKDLVDEKDLQGWGTLWNKKYENQVYLYDSIRDMIGIGALYNGYDINTKDETELKDIEKDLIELDKNSRGYGTDDLKNLVAAGDGAMAIVYSGDYLVTYEDQMATGGEVNVGYYVPEAGTNVWIDGIVNPTTSKNPELANKFINFMLETQNTVENCDYVGYTTTSKTVFEEFINSDEEMYKLEAYSLNDDTFSKSESYRSLGVEYTQIYSEIFTRVKNN